MFHIARDNAKDNADLMAHAVSHGVGLVHMDGYQPPEFPPEGFTSRDDINGYVQQIENILERMNFGVLSRRCSSSIVFPVPPFLEHSPTTGIEHSPATTNPTVRTRTLERIYPQTHIRSNPRAH